MYTQDDLEAAVYAATIQGDAWVNKATAIGAILDVEWDRWGGIDGEADADGIPTQVKTSAEAQAVFTNDIYLPAIARYKRGVEILKDAKIVTSTSHVCILDMHFEQLWKHEIISPILTGRGGFSGTTETYYLYALAKRAPATTVYGFMPVEE